jgi:amino acid transporter
VWWRRLAIVVVLTVLLPFSSKDYTLLWLYMPLVAFAGADPAPPPGRARAIVLAFALLLVPMSYVVFDGLRWQSGHWLMADVTSSVLVYPLLLIALLGLIVRDGALERTRMRAVTVEG